MTLVPPPLNHYGYSDEENFYGNMHHRHLGGGSFEVDYTVLAMVSATLVLLLLFELIRHYIDYSAQGNPFAQAVLATAYSERE